MSNLTRQFYPKYGYIENRIAELVYNSGVQILRLWHTYNSKSIHWDICVETYWPDEFGGYIIKENKFVGNFFYPQGCFSGFSLDIIKDAAELIIETSKVFT